MNENFEHDKNNNNNTILILLIVIMFLMYAFYQEKRITDLEQKIDKFEYYTNYLFNEEF